MTYSLNGGPSISLSMGPDTRRLASAGDFNCDIPFSSLVNGTNEVVVVATNTAAMTKRDTVTVNYSAGNTWPLPTTVNWSGASSIQNVAQVVDGQWSLGGGVVRPMVLAYDRLIGFGDTSWADYEVSVPITIHSIDPSGFNPTSDGPGVGLILRWNGHTNNPLNAGSH